MGSNMYYNDKKTLIHGELDPDEHGTYKRIMLNPDGMLTSEQHIEISNSANYPIIDDEDCPVYGYDTLCQMYEKTKGRVTPMQLRRNIPVSK